MVAESLSVVREGARVVAKVLDGANGTPANGRLSTEAARIAQKRSLAAEACTPELWKRARKTTMSSCDKKMQS